MTLYLLQRSTWSYCETAVNMLVNVLDCWLIMSDKFNGLKLFGTLQLRKVNNNPIAKFSVLGTS